MFLKRRKYYYLFLAIGWTVLLFHLSSMSYASQDIRPYLRLLVPEESLLVWLKGFQLNFDGSVISVETSGGYALVEFLFRKAAHLFFYFMLGFVIVRYFRSFLHNRRRRVFLLSCCMVLFISMLDEYLQYLHPDRSGRWIDVWLDCTGGLVGITAGYITSKASSIRKSASHSM
ncbi:VanZ family protein [Bacillus haimaensis]|uniref:VanZ family protein n=1 Tax=Bacillus haimaensis TaxID=3160967 RepID=UPI003AA88E7C